MDLDGGAARDSLLRDAVQIAIAAQVELVVHQCRRGVESIVQRIVASTSKRDPWRMTSVVPSRLVMYTRPCAATGEE